VPFLRPDDTARIAHDLIGSNDQALHSLKEQGACDLSYGLADVGRFRVNIFKQRGSHAIVMRVIAARIPILMS
jgi:twitching motility protein PilT